MSDGGRELRIGTRSSPLAMTQARLVQTLLQAAGHASRLVEIRTSGDRQRDQGLAAIGGQGVFVKEIEDALLSQAVDLAVHSLKDLPTRLPEGLILACVPEREDPRDRLLARDGRDLRGLPTGSIVGTSSPRRACQILHVRPDLAVKDLRGNVGTRLARFHEGSYDAIVLAAAGMARLGLPAEGRILDLDQMVPAVGQGALGIETRAADERTREALEPLHHPPTGDAVAAERAFLHRLGGGCRAPIAAVAEVSGGQIALRGLVADPLGRSVVRGTARGAAAEADALGMALAERLLGLGARRLLPRLDADA